MPGHIISLYIEIDKLNSETFRDGCNSLPAVWPCGFLLFMAEPASLHGQIRLKSGADSKVWMEEGIFGLFKWYFKAGYFSFIKKP
jgi:hypothetical protein